jgi:hypothetical protein
MDFTRQRGVVRGCLEESSSIRLNIALSRPSRAFTIDPMICWTDADVASWETHWRLMSSSAAIPECLQLQRAIPPPIAVWPIFYTGGLQVTVAYGVASLAWA